MRALSLKQPWAWAVLYAGKDLENRPQRTRLTGRVVVHASKTLDQVAVRTLRERGIPVPEDLPRGAHLGTVVITGCKDYEEVADSPWAIGPHCYTLEGAEPFEAPIAAKGMLGFFPVQGEAREIALAQERKGESWLGER